MAPYIYMERTVFTLSIYKLQQKLKKLNEAVSAASGRKISSVFTKKASKKTSLLKSKSCKYTYITERWPGGMLTNFVSKAVKKWLLLIIR
jgi:small subunit ribosomal protein S2